jgi:hypothetical protein
LTNLALSGRVESEALSEQIAPGRSPVKAGQGLEVKDFGLWTLDFGLRDSNDLHLDRSSVVEAQSQTMRNVARWLEQGFGLVSQNA